MNSLMWKQWRENRAYLASFTAWMVLAVVYAVGYELGHHYRAVIGSFSVLASFYTMIAAIFLAMRTSRGEQADGTMSFTAALPVSLRQTGTMKIAGAIATLAIPIVIGAGVLTMVLASGLVEQAMPRGVPVSPYTRLPQRGGAPLMISLKQLWSVTAIAIAGGTQLLLVLSLLGCWLRNQARVGLLGAVLALASMIAAEPLWHGERNAYLQLGYGVLLPQSLVVHWSYGDETGGYTDQELAHYRWAALGLAIPWLALIGYLFVTRFGKVQRPPLPVKGWRFRIAMPTVLSRVPIRLPSRWLAMFWLEARQSLPLVVCGLLLAILMSFVGVLTAQRRPQDMGTSMLMDLPQAMTVVGMLWAVVVGSSLYSADLGSSLGGFWRSRPIAPGLWFWCKFVVGLVAILVVLDAVTIVATWNAPRISPTTGMSWAFVACFPMIHALMFALAVLGTCWLRQPVIGGILAILAFAVVMMAVTAFPMTNQFELFNVFNNLLETERAGRINLLQHGYPQVYGFLTISTFVLAWLAFRVARPLEPARAWCGAPALGKHSNRTGV